jgi:hypothetical protein
MARSPKQENEQPSSMQIADDGVEQQIRTRAYELYVEHGCEDGHDVDNWLQAESEINS